MMHHLGVDGATLRRSIEEISRLDPAPGRHFETEIVQGIVPDILVYRGPYGEWMIQVNNDFIPSLRIQPTYRELMDRPDLAPEDKNYLRMKMRSGHYLIQSLLQRQRTIERITRALLEVQEDFFQKGPQGLQPLTLAQLAERLNVHETTVSRATANKFIETPFGVFEFRYFFTTGLANPEGCSVANTVVKQKISHIIRQEDGRNPVSDQEIVGLLKKDSICIARRTVAKYREALGLPAAHLRKKIY
jgi:RNA polymerase sigma-54 factor